MKLNYTLALLGALTAACALQAGSSTHTYILISGIAMLLVGIYRISTTIPSKNNDTNPPNDNKNQ